VISIFPIGSFPSLPLVELLASPSCNQLNGVGYDILPLIISNSKMDMIRCNGVIQNR
jgi:hypothetical protein